MNTAKRYLKLHFRLHEPEVKIQVLEPIKIEVIENAQNLNENPQDSNFNLNPRQTLLSFCQDGELIISKDNSYFDGIFDITTLS